MKLPARAIGLMSGTSLDGIDVALLRSDGEALIEPGPAATYPYDAALGARLREVLGGVGPVAEVEREVTLAHADAVARFLENHGIERASVDLIGFHGHTILHRPAEGRTWQIGDGALLAARTGIDVVSDFRSADVAAGGQGAPLAPLYHAALAASLEKPLAVLNLGGVANATWIGGDREGRDREARDREDGDAAPIAFDTGPANAPLDDWLRLHTGRAMDEGGALAASGRVDRALLASLLEHPYFAAPPPKSLDREDFAWTLVERLDPADGAATLTAFVAAAVAAGARHFPEPPKRWLITGGGRHNRALMKALREALEAPVEPVEQAGWQGDALEAQAFAWLAIRARRGLPLSVPSTTGVARSLSGGQFHPARKA